MEINQKSLLRLKGYILLTRRSLLLLSEMKIDFADYGFYYFLVLATDWDKRHSTYGFVNKTDSELASFIGCHPSTLLRRKRRLINAGLVVIKNKRIRVADFDRHDFRIARKLASMEVVDLQTDIAQTQEVIADMQSDIADSQNIDLKSDEDFNVSFKGDLSVFNNEEEVNPDDIPF